MNAKPSYEELEMRLEEASRKNRELAEENALQRNKITIASIVMHNIGNAITSLGNSVTKMLGEDKWPENIELAKLERMIQQKNDDFNAVLGKDKTRAFATFARELRSCLDDRRHNMYRDYQYMAKTISHVNEILHLQNRYAREGQIGQRALTDLGELIKDAVAICLDGFEKRRITVQQKTFDKLRPVFCDRALLVRVFLNLFKNMCKAFDEGENLDDRLLNIGIELPEPGKLRLEISHNAAGAEKNQMDRVFEKRFSRNPGTDLPDCHAIVEAHSGDMWFESSETGKIARTVIELPAVDDELARALPEVE